MKKFLFLAILFIAFYGQSNAQCSAGSVCTPQATLDHCADIADKYRQLLIVAEDRLNQLTALQKTSSDKDALIAAKDTIIKIGAMISDVKDQLIATLQASEKIHIDYEANLNKKIANGKSTLQKILTKLQIFYYALSTALLIAK